MENGSIQQKFTEALNALVERVKFEMGMGKDQGRPPARPSRRRARVHNLKNISLEIPRDSLTVVTGLSGSGKSSRA